MNLFQFQPNFSRSSFVADVSTKVLLSGRGNPGNQTSNCNLLENVVPDIENRI